MDTNLDWDAIIDDLAPALYRYFCARFTSQVADDLVQNTILRLIEKVQRFDIGRGTLRMYAFGIAHYIRLEYLRSHDLHEHTFSDEMDIADLSRPDESLDHLQQIQRLRAAIQNLSESQQAVIGLYLDEELSLDEIGAILQMPTSTVKSHVHRAKEALKVILGESQEVRS